MTYIIIGMIIFAVVIIHALYMVIKHGNIGEDHFDDDQIIDIN